MNRRDTPVCWLLLAVFLSLSCNLPLLRASSSGEARRLVLGEPTEILTASISSAGGELRIDQPGSPLDGLTITVPAGAYPGDTGFRISSVPILSHTYGEAFDPQIPLIHIDNGGAVAQGFLTVEVPLDVPQGSFPLAFTYDPETGLMEGLPLMPDAGVARIPMRSFSYITLAMIRENLLEGTITTAFDPRRDMWPFPNQGSSVAPAGYCAGESLTSLYYFDAPTRGPLMQAFDPFDNPHAATPGLPDDDRMGIRLSSAAQRLIKIDPSNADPNIDWWIRAQWDDPRVTYLTLAGIMLVTERPQLVHLQNPSTAHAVIAYGAEDGRRILIADPNHPGQERQLTYDPTSTSFASYQTGTTADSNPVNFDRVFFLRKRDVIDWRALAGLWQAFEAGSVGSDQFPSYTIWASSADPDDTAAPVPLVDGFQTGDDKLKLTFEPQGFSGKMVLHRQDGQAFDAVETGGSTVVELPEEQNVLGFLIEQTGGTRPLWVDFRWMRIGRGECLAPRESVATSYTWNREGAQRFSGSGGTGCRYEFTAVNVGEEPVVVLARSVMDNNSMHLETWERFALAPGGTGLTQVDRTLYTDGTVTYTMVDRMLVVRDVPECQSFLSEDNEAGWLAASTAVEDFSCD